MSNKINQPHELVMAYGDGEEVVLEQFTHKEDALHSLQRLKTTLGNKVWADRAEGHSRDLPKGNLTKTQSFDFEGRHVYIRRIP